MCRSLNITFTKKYVWLIVPWNKCEICIFFKDFCNLCQEHFHLYVLKWIPWNLTDDESTLVQVMTWCSQTPSHYLNQCWLTKITDELYVTPGYVELRVCSLDIFVAESILREQHHQLALQFVYVGLDIFKLILFVSWLGMYLWPPRPLSHLYHLCDIPVTPTEPKSDHLPHFILPIQHNQFYAKLK